MPRITKVYTRKGDSGETSLVGGQRLAKDAPRVEAYGTVDELSSALGLCRAQGLVARLDAMLTPIQNDLFHLGSDLCVLEQDKASMPVPQIEPRHIERLEGFIDELSEVLEPLANFILPGGSVGGAQLHLARTICRRAERCVVTLGRGEAVGEHTIRYLNRLSDLLFVMARYENQERGVEDVLWDSRA